MSLVFRTALNSSFFISCCENKGLFSAPICVVLGWLASLPCSLPQGPRPRAVGAGQRESSLEGFYSFLPRLTAVTFTQSSLQMKVHAPALLQRSGEVQPYCESIWENLPNGVQSATGHTEKFVLMTRSTKWANLTTLWFGAHQDCTRGARVHGPRSAVGSSKALPGGSVLMEWESLALSTGEELKDLPGWKILDTVHERVK